MAWTARPSRADTWRLLSTRLAPCEINAGLRLVEGLTFTVWDASDEGEDLEGDAVARFDQRTGTWWADLGPAGYRYVPAKDRRTDYRYLCVNCRRDLGAERRSAASRAEPTPVCPHCGTSRSAAIAPPAG